MITDSRSWEITQKSIVEIQKSDNGSQQGLVMEVVLNSQSSWRAVNAFMGVERVSSSRPFRFSFWLPPPALCPGRLRSMNSIKSFLCSASHWVWPEEFPIKFSQKEYWQGIWGKEESEGGVHFLDFLLSGLAEPSTKGTGLIRQPTQKSCSLGVGNGSSPCPSDLSGDHPLLLPALGYYSVTGSIFLNSVCISVDSSFIKFPSKQLLWVCPLFPSGTWLTDWMPVMNEKNGSFGCKTQG